MHICVFCGSECQPAPTERGWTRIDSERGLHFDCARKVAHAGNVIDRLELAFKGISPVHGQELVQNEWQLCPKCNGQGVVAKPPGLAAEVMQWGGTGEPFTCDVCNGKKIIARPVQQTPVINEEQSKEIWQNIATKFTGLIGTAQFNGAIEKLMIQYYPPQSK